MQARVAVEPETGIEAFLAQEQQKQLLRFSTAGSVDDGKSTLIGRLLYDSRGVYEDQLRAVAKASAARGGGGLDLSLLTDGLRAEREQGITIDVAYRYFATARRKFIIADTPGHEQYTRNMATGASTADLAIILIDARNGVLPQSRRHAYIANLLGIRHLVVAVNKMDVSDYDERVFRRIDQEFAEFLREIGAPAAYSLPLSALTGANVVTRSLSTPWFHGPSLLEYLETVEIEAPAEAAAFRFPVQYVIRPNQNFRGYAGQVASGVVRPGDEVIALPAGRRSRVRSITTFDGELDAAHAPMSVTLTLEDEIDISRGDMLARAEEAPAAARRFEADLVWMADAALEPGGALLIKHTSQMARAEVKTIRYRRNITTLEQEAAGTLALNEIGLVEIESARPLFFDAYQENRRTGAFILIDASTNATVAAGMIRRALAMDKGRAASHATEPVTVAERTRRYRHTGAVVPTGEWRAVTEAVERLLFDRGCAVWVAPAEAQATTVEALAAAGMLVLTNDVPAPALPEDAVAAAEFVCQQLEEAGVLQASNWFDSGEGI